MRSPDTSQENWQVMIEQLELSSMFGKELSRKSIDLFFRVEQFCNLPSVFLDFLSMGIVFVPHFAGESDIVFYWRPGALTDQHPIKWVPAKNRKYQKKWIDTLAGGCNAGITSPGAFISELLENGQ